MNFFTNPTAVDSTARSAPRGGSAVPTINWSTTDNCTDTTEASPPCRVPALQPGSGQIAESATLPGRGSPEEQRVWSFHSAVLLSSHIPHASQPGSGPQVNLGRGGLRSTWVGNGVRSRVTSAGASPPGPTGPFNLGQGVGAKSSVEDWRRYKKCWCYVRV